MAFAFARIDSTGADDAEDLSALDEAHHEQPAFTRITDDHFAVFAEGVIWVVFDASHIIVEHGLRLGERDVVLAEVLPFLISIPVECCHKRNPSNLLSGVASPAP